MEYQALRLGYFGIRMILESRAGDTLKKAQEYVQRKQYDYDYALRLFEDAQKAANRFPVGASTKKKVMDEYSKHTVVLAEKIKAKEAFQKAFDELGGVYGDVMRAVKEKHAGKALQHCNKAMKMLNKLSPCDDDDKENLKILKRNLNIQRARIKRALKRAKKTR